MFTYPKINVLAKAIILFLLFTFPNLTNYYFSFDSKIDGDAPDFELYQMQYLRAVKRLCEKYQMTDNIFIKGDMSLLKKARTMGLTNKMGLNIFLKICYP